MERAEDLMKRAELIVNGYIDFNMDSYGCMSKHEQRDAASAIAKVMAEWWVEGFEQGLAADLRDEMNGMGDI